jgi:hypothetical protein
MSGFTDVALQFAVALVAEDFLSAHEMLCANMRAQHGAEQLQAEYTSMLALYEDSVETVEVTETLENWRDKQPHDLGWAYVAISGKTFSEAVTVVVTDEHGRLCVRSVEWGRP